MNEGPTFTLKVTCTYCDYLESKYYCIEDGNSEDSGFDYTCKKGVDLSNYDYVRITPQTCPFYDIKLQAFIDSVQRDLNNKKEFDETR